MTLNNENVQRRTRQTQATQAQEQTNATQEQTNETANHVITYSAVITSITRNSYNTNKVTIGINKEIPSFDKDGTENTVNYININSNRFIKECAMCGDSETSVIFGLLGDFKRPKPNVLAFALVGKIITFERVLHEAGESLEDGEVLQNTGFSTTIKSIKGTANPRYLPLLQKALLDNDLEEKATIGTSIFDAINV